MTRKLRMAEYNIEKFDKTARGEKGEVGSGEGWGLGGGGSWSCPR